MIRWPFPRSRRDEPEREVPDDAAGDVPAPGERQLSRRSLLLGGAALGAGVAARRIWTGFGAGTLHSVAPAPAPGLIASATLAPPASPFGPMVENGGLVLVRKRVRADGLMGEVIGYEESFDGGRTWGRVVGSLA